MSSEIRVNTVNEGTSASGVTIDGVLIKDGLVDGKDVSTLANSVAFTEVDAYVLNTDVTGDENPIAGTKFTRHTGTLLNYPIGSGMSVNSTGHWTFPSTGFYEVTFIANVENDTNSNASQISIHGTDNNFVGTDVIALSRFYGNDNSRTNYQCMAIVDITDVANDKVSFQFDEQNQSTLHGTTAEMHSGVMFIKIAST